MTTPTAIRPPPSEPKPIVLSDRSTGEQILVKAFVLIPFATLIGVTVGYHRYFTHRAFTARRGLRIALAVAGGLAAQGPVISWVADHRRHHGFSWWGAVTALFWPGLVRVSVLHHHADPTCARHGVPGQTAHDDHA
jgi:hypothetical protein